MSDESFVKDGGLPLSRSVYSYGKDGRLTELFTDSLPPGGEGMRVLHRYDKKGFLMETRHFNVNGKSETLAQTVSISYTFY